MSKIIYLISGLGADERLFTKLDVGDAEMRFIRWIEPLKNESLADYAARLSQQITTKKPTILGLSFGGMLAVEMAKIIDCQQVIIISSAKSHLEIPLLYRWTGKLYLHKLVPFQFLRRFTGLTNWIFGMTTVEERDLLQSTLANIDPQFLKWAVDAILSWRNTVRIKNLLHIHGTKDCILPPSVKTDIAVAGGKHLMLYSKAAEINEILRRALVSGWLKTTPRIRFQNRKTYQRHNHIALKNNEEIERQLFLKQLQINRLLDITQAINNNVPAGTLYVMYKSFLNWELGVRQLALFLRNNDDRWQCMIHDGVSDDSVKDTTVIDLLPTFDNTMRKLGSVAHPFARLFEMVIPVYHKDEPIAYAFIGGYDGGDFSKVQMITTITNIVAVAIENKRLFKRQIEQERFNHEMSLAGEVQQSLVPDKLPKNAVFEVSAIYKPHFGVGGDYFDCFAISESSYLFTVADISGKGLSAALLMANFQAHINAIARRATTPEEFIRQLNKAVWRVTKGERYITFFAAEFDVNTRRMRYINAGHIPPILISNGERQLLKKGCTLLGFFPSLPALEIGELTIEEEALMVIFTDGITDVRNPIGSDFSEEILADFAAEHSQFGAKPFNQELMKRIDEFKGEEAYPDDITVLTAKFFKKS
jgi:phosphoserine phosphatase RsbU/P